MAKKKMQKTPRVKRGEIYFANLNPVVGSEQGGVRPVLILQNDTGNKYSPTTIVAAVTSRHKRARLPTHVPLAAREGPLDKDSVVLLEQVRTIDKSRLKEKIGKLSPEELAQVQEALKLSLGFDEKHIENEIEEEGENEEIDDNSVSPLSYDKGQGREEL
jgi:mRNA interferase MazF